MIFGVFDGLHEGHVSFLKQARALGDRLVAVVAKDESVKRLKNRYPRSCCSERMEELSNSGLVHVVSPGDDTEGGWGVVLMHRPDVIALGYDQIAMHEHLVHAIGSFPFTCQLVMLEPHEPEVYHSSLLQAALDG